MYKALIRSVLDYGSRAFDSAYKSSKDRLDRIQSKGAMAPLPVMLQGVWKL